jgi:hypothetical protein
MRWQPSTYRQVWLFAVLGPGCTGFAIWSVMSWRFHMNWLAAGLTYGVMITLLTGLGQSHRLRRRRRRQAELEALYAAALRMRHHES